MAELVSPCCGAEYTDVDEHVSSCCEAIFHDPGWPDNDICSKCKEHTDSYEYICENCDESFEEPEVDYEYNARMAEYYAEQRADERRDMGL